MKQVTFFFLALFSLCIIFSSCKKSNDPAPTAPGYVGLWKGKYGTTTAYPTAGYAFLFRNDGTVRVFNNADTTSGSKAEGTYAISGGTVTTTYTYLAPGSGQYSTSTTINPNYTFQEGTWGSGTNTTNGGNFFIVKQ